MIKLKQISKEHGDCTADYIVEFKPGCTVSEFVSDVLKRESDWGAIGIFDKEQSWFERGNPYCEYKRGNLLSNLPNEYMNKVIIKAEASGGWSLMNFKLHLE